MPIPTLSISLPRKSSARAGPKLVADPLPARAWTQVRPGTRRSHGEPQEDPHRHSAGAECLRLCSAFQRLPRKPRGAAGEHHLLRLHQRRNCTGRAPAAGAIDPCFPAKVGISHVYNLIQEKHRKKPLNVIFFPMYDVLTTPLTQGGRQQRLPHGDGHARDREGRIHQGNRCLRRAPCHLPRPDPELRGPEAVRLPDVASVEAPARAVRRRKRSRRRGRAISV